MAKWVMLNYTERQIGLTFLWIMENGAIQLEQHVYI